MTGTRVVTGVVAGLALYALAACSPEGTLTAPTGPAFDIASGESAQVRVCKSPALDELGNEVDGVLGETFGFTYQVDGGAPTAFSVEAVTLSDCPTGAFVINVPGPASQITITEDDTPGFELVTLVFTDGSGPCTVTGTPDVDNRSITLDICGTGSLAGVFFKNRPVEEPPPPGLEGCTPGYWKAEQHHDSWVGFAPGQTVGSVFDGGATNFAGSTLLQALNFGGGPGVDGAEMILLRAAVAALLNAASPDVDYPHTTAEVIAAVNAALASDDRPTILALATELDDDNNLGCPLN